MRKVNHKAPKKEHGRARPIPALLAVVACIAILALTVPTTLADLFFPGSQPNDSGNFETPDKCQACHGGYDRNVEPSFNWKGSMMAQAARDPLYEACMTISNQDVPFSGDLCIRCHAPAGWLGGRSTPTDGTALTTADKEGIYCDFCHRMVRPSPVGTNPYPLDLLYTSLTYPADQTYISKILSVPVSQGNGSYVVDSDNTKRGPFSDAGANHKFFYSPYHSKSEMCGTCHDVSNPVYSRNPDGTYSANPFDQPAPSFNTYDLFPVERTYSEWLMSEYNTPGGVYAPNFGGNKEYVSTCQDCHLRDKSGVAANKSSAVYRDDLPLHDMTGGNTFAPLLIKSLYPGLDSAALNSAIVRARYMLRNAATLDLQVDNIGGNLEAKVRVTNETGHKLPSGYPEGRRIWINLVAKDESGTVVYESGHYDFATAILTKDGDAKVYEIKPGLDATIASLTGFEEGPGFHFVLNNKIFFDNRIPPRGFTNENFDSIQSPPVGYVYEDGQYWDETTYLLPPEAVTVRANLYYQSVSKEYVEFLRSENKTNNKGEVLYNLWSANGKSAPELMNTATVILSPTAVMTHDQTALTVFPNPATDMITFRFPRETEGMELRISVMELSGKYIYRSEPVPRGAAQIELSVASLLPGQYLYMIEGDRGTRYSGSFLVRK